MKHNAISSPPSKINIKIYKINKWASSTVAQRLSRSISNWCPGYYSLITSSNSAKGKTSSKLSISVVKNIRTNLRQHIPISQHFCYLNLILHAGDYHSGHHSNNGHYLPFFLHHGQIANLSKQAPDSIIWKIIICKL